MFWTADRADFRVQAALTVPCKLCGAKPGDDCRSIGDARKPLTTGHIHQIRVPHRILGVAK